MNNILINKKVHVFCILIQKIPIAMRMTLVLLFAVFLQLQAEHLYSQDTKISLDMNNSTVEKVLQTIEQKSDYYFLYNSRLINVDRKLNIRVKDTSIATILDRMFASEKVNYEVKGSQIILSPKDIYNQITVVSQNSQAQPSQKAITGKITDTEGEPIIGANILEKDIPTNGTVTDYDGNFSLKVNQTAILQISYIGYLPQEINTTGETSFNIVLLEDTKALDEVVVIGYGTQKKSDVSGSITTVSGEKIATLPTSGASEALQGMAPGLSVNFGSGAPGQDPQMMVRGITSWGSSNSPLVVIDGVPSDISYLNPEDIKSMTVLKDAAMAAIYGARSAAGVILIETHRGGKQTPKIQFSSFVGIDDLPKRMEVANSAEYIKINKLALTNAGIPTNRWPKYIEAYEANPSQFADTDWQSVYYRKGITQKYNISYIAGSENMNVALSGFYSSTEGVVANTSAVKYGFRLNSDVIRGNFKMGESISYGKKTDRPEANTGFPGMFQTTNIQPLIFVYDDKNEGGYGGAIAGLGMTDAANPVAFNNLIDTKNENDYITASAYLQYKPISDLTFKFQAARNIDFYHYKSFTPTYYVGANSVNTIARLTETRSRNIEDLLELTANYDKVINEEHSLQAMLGLSQEERKFDDQIGSASKFENNDMRYLRHGQDNFSVGGGFYRNALQSAFGRLSYNYDLRYMFMMSARYDGSSRFGAGNKWGFFPSASLGWNIANESFWNEMKDDISTFKFRLSYGALGNQSIGDYMYIPRLTSNTWHVNYPLDGRNINLGYAILGLPSTNIKWETTFYKNIGIDLGFWNNKLELTLEGYIKDTQDMLSSKNISLATGFGSLIVNEGKLQTKGLEFQAIYHGSIGKLKYDLDMNVSHYKSVLKQMSDPGYLYEDGPARTYVGGEIGEFWVLKTAGLFQSVQDVENWNKQYGYNDDLGNWHPLQPAAKPGDVKFIDQNNDGKLDSNDRVLVGSGNPKAVLGFNINVRYNAFDLVANFYGNFGVKRYNYMKRQLQRMDGNFNYGKDALNSWTPENTNTDIPRAVIGDPNGNIDVSDRFVENGDYLRLNNLQIGYNLPSKICKAIDIDNLRFYVGATRLFTLTNYKGYDPGTGAANGGMGVDYAIYPLSRTLIFGLKLGF